VSDREDWVPEGEVDLTAEPGTEEGDRAQDRVMWEGAADAEEDTAGP
jgi:hypothetical protein